MGWRRCSCLWWCVAVTENHANFPLKAARVAAQQKPAHARLVSCVHIVLHLHWQAHPQPTINCAVLTWVSPQPATGGVQYPRTHARAAAATQSVNEFTSHTSRGAQHNTLVRTPCQQQRVCTSNPPTASVQCMHHSGACLRHTHISKKLASRNATPSSVDSTQQRGGHAGCGS